MTHSTQCCWSTIKRIDSANNRNIKPNDIVSVSPAKVFLVSQKKSPSFFPFSSCPSQGALSSSPWCGRGKSAHHLSLDSRSVWHRHTRTHPCATRAHTSAVPISEYLHYHTANSASSVSSWSCSSPRPLHSRRPSC